MQRLVYTTLADFVPGVAPYFVESVIEFVPEGAERVRMVLTFDAMHDERWTKLAVMGREGELRKLAKLIESRRQTGQR